MSISREKKIEHIVAEKLVDYFDGEGASTSTVSGLSGINQVVDLIRTNRGDEKSADSVQELIGKPSTNHEKHFTGVYPGGQFTIFVVKVVTKELNKIFSKDIYEEKAAAFAAKKIKELFDLLKETVMNPILQAKPLERDISGSVAIFLEDLETKLLGKENPEMFDLYAYLFYNSERPLPKLLQDISYEKDEVKNESTKTKKPSKSKDPQFTAEKRLEKIAKLKAIASKLSDSKKYVSDYDYLLKKLNQYEKEGILSETHSASLRKSYIESYGEKAEKLRASQSSLEVPSKPGKFAAMFSFLNKNKNELKLKVEKSPGVDLLASPLSALSLSDDVLSPRSPFSPRPVVSHHSTSGLIQNLSPSTSSTQSPPSDVQGQPVSVLPEKKEVVQHEEVIERGRHRRRGSLATRFNLDEELAGQEIPERGRHRRRGSLATRFNLDEEQQVLQEEELVRTSPFRPGKPFNNSSY